MTPTSVINLLPSTSDEVNRFANNVIQSVKNGEENPLQMLLQVRAMEKAFKIITEKIKENYMSEADKYPGDKFEFKGNEIQKGDVKTEYDYSNTGDIIWEQRVSAMAAAETLVKEREAFLKALKEPITLVDEGSGEVYTVRPPIKKTTQGLKIFMK